MKKIISLLLTAALIATSGGNVVFAEEDMSKEPSSSAASARPEQMQSGLETIIDEEQTDPDQIVTAIIELEDEPLISKAEGMKNSDIYSSENKETLLSKQRSVQKKISGKVLDGQSLEVVRSYTVAANGFAAKVPYGKLDDIRKISGVASVYVAPEFKVAPNMHSSISSIGGMENTSGYNGEGTVIAIVDTGLETSHEAFRAAPISPALTKDDITAVLQKNDLHAEESVNGLTASQVYRSAKIPFAFDYADDDTDVAPGSAGDHGTHVAGIASANTGVQADVSGVASQSQLLVMKVFSSGASNGATWDDILAALDDAVCLGADVINMSLGSTAGFASIEADEGVSAVYQRVTDAGIMLAVAGGNEYSSAFGNMMGKGHALAQNPDYGTIASPSSYNASMAVASVDRADVIQSYYFTAGTKKIAFNDTAEDSTVSGVDENSVRFRSLSGSSVSYAVISGYGETKDYESADVSGKIALVSRGSVDYAAKKKAAKEAGAAGIIVYNNEPGMLFMQLDSYDFPAAFISQADGQWLCDQAGEVQLNIANSQGSIDSPTSGQMSDFSSWGVTPELTLKPDITAPGGNIKSTITGNSYGTKSGTSMASPYVAGAMAVVKQYVEHKLVAEADSETEKADLVNSIIMSTADIVYEENGTPYSPRKQGAGSVNVDRAVRSSSYVTVPGMKLPKIELGDDVEKTGVYTMSADIHNHSDKAITYRVGGTVQTDGAEITKQYKGKDVWQNTERPYKLEASVVGNDVTVEAGKTANVQVTVTLYRI